MQLIYTGTLKANQGTAGAGNVTSNGTWIAQSFSTSVGQTTIGYVTAQVFPVSGNTPPPLTVAIYANAAGAPTGSALGTTTVAYEYGASGPLNLPIPMPITGLTASTTYWIVTQAVGTSGNRWQWNKSNQVSGASTSPDGITWTAQAYGLLYQVFDQVSVNPLVFTWEDSGARWTWRSYQANNTQISQIAEFTAGQTSTTYTQSFRTFSYTGGLVTQVT